VPPPGPNTDPDPDCGFVFVVFSGNADPAKAETGPCGWPKAEGTLAPNADWAGAGAPNTDVCVWAAGVPKEDWPKAEPPVV